MDVFRRVPVVQLHTKLLGSGFPARSLTPVVIVPVYLVLGTRLPAGVKIRDSPKYVTIPGTGRDPCVKVKVDAEIVETSITLLKVAIIFVLRNTSVAPSGLTVWTTAGRLVSMLEPVVQLHA